VRRLDAAFTQWEKGIAGFRARRVKAGSARRTKDERIGGFHPVASREAALAGAARPGVRRLDAAFAQWEEGIA